MRTGTVRSGGRKKACRLWNWKEGEKTGPGFEKGGAL